MAKPVTQPCSLGPSSGQYLFGVVMKHRIAFLLLVLSVSATANANRVSEEAAKEEAPQPTDGWFMEGDLWRPTLNDKFFPTDSTNFWVFTDGTNMVTLDVSWLADLGKTGNGSVRLIGLGPSNAAVRTFGIVFDQAEQKGWGPSDDRYFSGTVWRGNTWLPGTNWRPSDDSVPLNMATVTLATGLGPVALTATDGTEFTLKYAVVNGQTYRP